MPPAPWQVAVWASQFPDRKPRNVSRYARFIWIPSWWAPPPGLPQLTKPSISMSWAPTSTRPSEDDPWSSPFPWMWRMRSVVAGFPSPVQADSSRTAPFERFRETALAIRCSTVIGSGP
jgi:hypothetical protein